MIGWCLYCRYKKSVTWFSPLGLYHSDFTAWTLLLGLLFDALVIRTLGRTTEALAVGFLAGSPALTCLFMHVFAFRAP